jgi:hypothetical protein
VTTTGTGYYTELRNMVLPPLERIGGLTTATGTIWCVLSGYLLSEV